MHVVENTDLRLVVLDRPWLVRAVLWLLIGSLLYALATTDEQETWRTTVAIVVLAGLVWITLTGFPTLRLEFDRDAGRLCRTRWYLGLRRQDGMDLSTIREIRQEARWSGSSRGRRLVIETVSKPAPLTDSYGSRDLTPIADEINEWLTRPVGR